MKKIITLLLAFILIQLANKAKAQYVLIPDSNFATWLNTHGYSSAMIGNTLDTTNALVLTDTVMLCTNQNIKNIAGIKYFKNLRRLSLFDCNIHDSIYFLPDSIRYLDCSSNYIPFIASLPSQLIVLTCWHNQLTVLPPLPSTLVSLNCSDNWILNLNLPNNLLYLDCSYYGGIGLPILPNTLLELTCNSVWIATLNNLPNGLRYLNCSNNVWLTTISNLPDSLIRLECAYSILSSLTGLNSKLQFLDVNHNSLSTLPELPNSLYLLNCSYNVLHCLPDLKNVHILEADTFNEIACIPNRAHLTGRWYVYPLCNSQLNPNLCNFNWNITGTVYLDANNNCVNDSGDAAIDKCKVKLYSHNMLIQETRTNVVGEFLFDVSSYDTFEYVIDTVLLPNQVSCPLYRTSIISSTDSTDDKMDFGFTTIINGVYESKDLQTIAIYPNPTFNSTTIALSKKASNTNIKVMNAIGETVLEQLNLKGNQYTIDLTQQSPGVYFIELRQSDHVWHSKLVKQ
jgi:hypothetical protein